MKTKYLTTQEKEDKALTELELLVEKLERRYNCQIMWNVDEFIHLGDKYMGCKKKKK